MEKIAPKNSLGMRFTTVYGTGARESMLIPKLLKKDISYINVDHFRDFIHVEDLMSAIKILIKNNVKDKVLDIGTGKSINLLDLLYDLNIKEIEKRMGTMFERKDNKADINVLTNLNWKPQIDLLNYLKENYDN